MVRTALLPALLAAAPLLAQTGLQRTLNADTMPNLVPNPGFEETRRLQCAWTQDATKFNEEVMVGWTSPTETTPDHFSMLSDPGCWSHPGKRTDGRARPHGGVAMAGIKTWGRGNTPTHWHEYLQIELAAPLEAGVRYVAECWVMRASFSNEASNNIGLLLATEPIRSRDCLPLYITPMVNEDKLVKKSGWHKVNGVIEAAGGERFVLVGNFYSDEATQHERFPEGERGAYYFVDDVNVRVAPPGSALSPKPSESVPPPPKVRVADHAGTAQVELPRVEPEVGKSIVLDHIFFDFDKADLKPESHAELEKVVHLLTDYPHMRIEIGAHTDDQGSEAYNIRLSNDRAKAVVDHLVKQKVDADRLSWKGYGKSRPVADNSSEEGRARNRRVEFTVLER
ncbi:MAG: OmpA family protein [Flavobacteriales bacterium]|jgi:outer membrane protein OmpA-like peptidoglycan-associated protein|nr:OmpA family protein [Flavobacteriales bacterium]MBK7942317.1 OmpA family protein [Flavobacteriales bacterium]